MREGVHLEMRMRVVVIWRIGVKGIDISFDDLSRRWVYMFFLWTFVKDKRWTFSLFVELWLQDERLVLSFIFIFYWTIDD
jgi:hypothetical protein